MLSNYIIPKDDVTPLVLVTNIQETEPKTRETISEPMGVEAVLLSPFRSVDYSLPTWIAWMPGNDLPITCEVVTYEIPFIGVDAGGSWFSGVTYPPNQLSISPGYIRDVACCKAWLYIGGTKTFTPTPFLLGPQNKIHFMHQAGTVALSMQHLDQSADVLAHADYFKYQSKHQKYQDWYSQRIDEYMQQAHRLTPRKGDYLPVTVTEGKRTVAGCIRLNAHKRWSWGKPMSPIFKADFYWSDRVRHLEPGTVLFRKIAWQEDGEQKEIQTEVATIISLD